jgi:DNA uptake protein ComE-like DNA-binding protein
MNFFESGNHSYKEWFEFSKKEQRGVIVLLVLIFALIAARIAIVLRPADDPIMETKAYEILEWASKEEEDGFERPAQDVQKGSKSFPDCFPFDPNTCDIQVWKNLGLSEKQASVILRYVSKGGKFRTVNDLKKMYVLPEGFADHVATCAAMPAVEENHQNPFPDKWVYTDKQHVYSSKPYEPVLVEMNSADSLELRRIPGIGPYFARKIHIYREKLGGFYDVSQLLEVYRMTAPKLDSIRDFIQIDPSFVRKMNINAVDLATLSLHPYISKREASALIAYRDKHGSFAKVDDILLCKALDENTFLKIRNYLEVP